MRWEEARETREWRVVTDIERARDNVTRAVYGAYEVCQYRLRFDGDFIRFNNCLVRSPKVRVPPALFI